MAKNQIIYLILFFMFWALCIQEVSSQNTNKVRLAFYNVENLFDTINEPEDGILGDTWIN
jgi:hypothetical protein